MIHALLILAIALQGIAVAYGVVLLSRRRGAAGAWLFLLGAMLSMLVWRIFVVTGVRPSQYFNPVIAIWGSTCMLAAMFLFGREVARRERAERERDALLSSERAARTEAERASRLKDDFLATLSHELRTPLAAILGWCTLLRMNDKDQASVDRAVETIERNALVQARLVDDLLDATRIQAGTLHLDLATVQLDVPVKEALESVRPLADDKQVSLDLRIAGEPPRLLGDKGRLQQIAANLLVNAVKFTPPGGRVEVFIFSEGGSAGLDVVDTGQGISADFLPHLFNRFRQADGSIARRHGGLGLGLSIVASLTRLHGGEVWAHSEGVGMGSTFSVRLPLAPSSEKPSGAEQKPHAPMHGLHGVRILLIDDEPDVRSAAVRLLEQYKAEVLALDSGAGIESVLADFKPDLLILDIGMPGEDGYTLIRRIRTLSMDAGGGTPAISLTAHARSEDRARALDSGFQEHLSKPIDLPLLIATITGLLAGKSDKRIAVSR